MSFFSFSGSSLVFLGIGLTLLVGCGARGVNRYDLIIKNQTKTDYDIKVNSVEYKTQPVLRSFAKQTRIMSMALSEIPDWVEVYVFEVLEGEIGSSVAPRRQLGRQVFVKRYIIDRNSWTGDSSLAINIVDENDGQGPKVRLESTPRPPL